MDGNEAEKWGSVVKNKQWAHRRSVGVQSHQNDKKIPSRHEDRIGGQDGLQRGSGRMTNGIKIEHGRPILPHAWAGERVDSVRLDRGGVLMSARHFLG